MLHARCGFTTLLLVGFAANGTSRSAADQPSGRAHRSPSPSLETKVLFAAGKNGYKCYRIPAMVPTTNGTMLAFCEARKNNCSDSGDIDLVMKRSADGGQTWSDAAIIADDGNHTMGNPCPIVDASDGTIWLPFCRDNKTILVTKSTDDGRTWSPPLDITDHAKDPAWHWVGTGPGHGIQLRTGRLVVPSWADATSRLGEIQFSYLFYTDDHGRTWTRGEALDRNASDECEVVELADATLYMSMRSRQGKKQRAYATSKDGGHTWSRVKYDPRLPEPSCQGSIVRLTNKRNASKNRVLLASPANPNARSHMTVRLSYDECRTWPVSKILYEGSSAYCDLAVTPHHQILLLYEADDYTKIILARFNLQWLSDGQDRLP